MGRAGIPEEQGASSGQHATSTSASKRTFIPSSTAAQEQIKEDNVGGRPDQEHDEERTCVAHSRRGCHFTTPDALNSPMTRSH